MLWMDCLADSIFKAHYRPEFMAAMMTCYNGDRNKVSRYISDTRRAGVKIAAPDVNRSEAGFP